MAEVVPIPEKIHNTLKAIFFERDRLLKKADTLKKDIDKHTLGKLKDLTNRLHMESSYYSSKLWHNIYTAIPDLDTNKNWEIKEKEMTLVEKKSIDWNSILKEFRPPEDK